MIPFHKNMLEEKTSFESQNQKSVLDNEHYLKCLKWFENNGKYKQVLFTKSCTQSLELAVLSLNLEQGSEIILPSFSFVSLANAINNLGYKCIFIDCDKDTMNVSVEAIEQAITLKTKAIIVINYSGVACDYDSIKPICAKHNLYLIEDNAHGVTAKYKGNYLGSFGDISTISFDFLKNINCFEGGAIMINNVQMLNNIKVNYDFGTNRAEYLAGQTDHYEWRGKGSNCRLAKPLFSYLAAQLDQAESIIAEFLRKWWLYQNRLEILESSGKITRAIIPPYAEHNAHMFWLKVANFEERKRLIAFLENKGVQATFHYSPLHSSEYGRKVGEFRGSDINTTIQSARLLRLPLYYSLTDAELNYIVDAVFDFYY